MVSLAGKSSATWMACGQSSGKKIFRGHSMKADAKLFYTHEAMEYGVDRAILINYLRLFISGNKARGENIHEGATYTHNTYDEIVARHPFWSKQKVGRIVRSLIDDGVLLVSCLAENPWDRRSYYAFADEGKFLASHVIKSESSEGIKSEPCTKFKTEPSYTKESLKSPKEFIGLIEEYFVGRGLDPVQSEHMANEFYEYWTSTKPDAISPENFKRRAATWLKNAERFGQVAKTSSKLTKSEFAELQARARIENKTFDPSGWMLEGDYWIKRD